MTNYANTIGGAWNSVVWATSTEALKATFRSKMTPERKGQDGGFRVFRNCREMLRNG